MAQSDSEFKSGSIITELRETLRNEVDKMSESTLRILLHEAMKVISSLQFAINARRPIFTLPTELFNHIMEEITPITVPIGSSKIDQFWRPLFRDSTTLIPVSQTCRHFRQIALAHSEWWSTIASQKLRHYSVCTANSWPLSFTVVAFPEGETDVFAVFNDTTAARLEEVHAVRCNQTVMRGVRNLFQTDSRAPALKALTCISTIEDRVHPITLDPERVWALKHLVLDRVEFWFYGSIPYQMPSITHLVLAGSSASHRNIAQLIGSCPNLQTLVLSELFSGADGAVPNSPFPISTRIRRVALHDLRHSALEFYLALIRPRTEGRPMALQILNEQAYHNQFEYEPLIEQRLHGKATHLRIGVFTDTASFYRFSVTIASRANALRFASTASNLAASRYGRPDAWLARLLHADVADLSDVHEAWLFNTTAPFTVYLTTFQVAVRTVMSGLSALEALTLVTVDHPSDGPGNVLWPDISVVPTTDDSEWGCHRLKTLRMVHYDALPPRTQGDPNVFQFERARIKMEFTRMLDLLALGGYGYLENLVVQASPRFEIDEAEVAALRTHFKSVVVERILELPRMWLPPVCVGSDDGPGGRDSWTTTHY